MLFERFEDPGLSQYSYAVGCQTTGQLAIVDPRRDVDVYLHFAEDRSMRIAHVLETHIHADYASGAGELAKRTGAELWLSAYDAGETYESTLPHRELRDGAAVTMGRVRLEALHTPGHTPEHVSLLVYDGARSETVPELLLSGDFLFVGSVGRPDLLGEQAKRDLARRLFHSVREKLAGLPEGLEVHPGHGAGSMCGSGMSGRPQSTLGYERAANSYLDASLDEDAFVEHVLSHVPPFPDYYRRMKRVNAAGAPVLEGLPGNEAVAPEPFRALLRSGYVAIDLRDQLAFGGGHVPRAFGIGAGGSLSQWAAWVVPYETPILLVTQDGHYDEDSVRALVRVGLDEVRGYLRGGMHAWVSAGLPVAETPQISPLELHRRLSGGNGLRVLDVRTDDEWEDGHIAGAVHVMGGTLPSRLDEVPRDGGGPLAVVCGSGYRSTVAVSVLERAGFEHLLNVTGGMGAWHRAGLPTVRD
ncbi:MAG TPA: rhodanese-like domain-containing protein [Gemmatimonadota bacterium]|jgi:hydroxyacylglutathione hydrolase